jgi:hypothetical protein
LSDDRLAVIVLPERGCDVHAVIAKHHGVDVLFKPPWGLRSPASGLSDLGSEVAWLSTYSGGWQVLLPNAGEERSAHGTRLGFHGEAALARWDVEATGVAEATLRTDLMTVPISLRRTIGVGGSAVVVHEAITNQSPEPVEVGWCHHPAFGGPMLDGGAVLDIPAAEFVPHASDDRLNLPVGQPGPWPVVHSHTGEAIDLSAVPNDGAPRAVFGSLLGVDPACARIDNRSLSLRAELRWPAEMFPYTWLWMELSASPGFPWYRRARAVGIEPSTMFAPGGTGGLVVKPGETLDATVELFVGESL